MRFISLAQFFVASVIVVTVTALYVLQTPYTGMTELTQQLSAYQTSGGESDTLDKLTIDISALQKQTEHRMLWLSAISVGMIILMLLALRMLHQSITTPLHQLNNGLRHLTEGRLDQRIYLNTPHYLFHDVVAKMNHIAGRLQNSQAVLAEIATRDTVTGLFNKQEFYRRVHEEVARHHRYGSRLCIVLVRIDQYNDIVNIYGDEAGKVLLKCISARIAGQIRTMDCLARIDNGEFGLVLPETPGTGGYVVAERIRNDFEKQGVTIMQGHEVDITLSLGIDASSEKNDNDADLLEQVQKSLSLASASDGNRVGNNGIRAN